MSGEGRRGGAVEKERQAEDRADRRGAAKAAILGRRARHGFLDPHRRKGTTLAPRSRREGVRAGQSVKPAVVCATVVCVACVYLKRVRYDARFEGRTMSDQSVFLPASSTLGAYSCCDRGVCVCRCVCVRLRVCVRFYKLFWRTLRLSGEGCASLRSHAPRRTPGRATTRGGVCCTRCARVVCSRWAGGARWTGEEVCVTAPRQKVVGSCTFVCRTAHAQGKHTRHGGGGGVCVCVPRACGVWQAPLPECCGCVCATN